jgi:hypothetical protein
MEREITHELIKSALHTTRVNIYYRLDGVNDEIVYSFQKYDDKIRCCYHASSLDDPLGLLNINMPISLFMATYKNPTQKYNSKITMITVSLCKMSPFEPDTPVPEITPESSIQYTSKHNFDSNIMNRLMRR